MEEEEVGIQSGKRSVNKHRTAVLLPERCLHLLLVIVSFFFSQGFVLKSTVGRGG